MDSRAGAGLLEAVVAAAILGIVIGYNTFSAKRMWALLHQYVSRGAKPVGPRPVLLLGPWIKGPFPKRLSAEDASLGGRGPGGAVR